ncbi:NlpC/P60 family protein [Glycomyces buryatensis]|uniref:NlpC/P60 domain-containing protein n=1 Tax=Glycomyces buryatensis TaxID=2570927 RepID=A0A4S8Q940_9ACTN|nr:C40 family peptidase [Glycomyces buryatensis]THV40953.1 hypothetical protein FAB82_13980 [Glycomyces buryatensis]
MYQLSPRRKWTSLAVIGGLLVAAVSSTPAWADRDVSDINDEIEANSEDLNAAVEAYNGLAQEIADNEELLEEAQAEVDTAEAELNELRDQLADFINETYVDQGVGDAALILESGSPQAFVERLERLNSANLYNFDLMEELQTVSDEYTSQLELLEDLQSDLEADKDELEKQKEDLEERTADLEAEWQVVAGEDIPGFNENNLPHMNNDELAVVEFALDQLGEQYVFGSAGPDTWDCSGLIMRAYEQIGISLPHNAAQIYNQTAQIGKDQLQPGDLVFYNNLSHMGMYIGNGLIVHAPNSTTVVKIVEVDHGNSWVGATTILH